MMLMDYTENLVLNWLVGRPTSPLTALTPYLSLSSICPNDTTAVGAIPGEFTVGSNGYARYSLPGSSSNGFYGATAAGGAISNPYIINMGTPSADWGACNAVMALTDATAGSDQLLWYIQTPIKNCLAGVPVSFPVGSLRIAMATGAILSTTVANQICQWLVGLAGQAQKTVYLSLSSAVPAADGSGAAEINPKTSGGVRLTVTHGGGAHFQANAANGMIANAAVMDFQTPDKDMAGVSAICICAYDNSATIGSGTPIWWIPIPAKQLTNGVPIQIPIGALLLSGD